MNIKTRLYALTALNVGISLTLSLIGYFGIERLHPKREQVTAYLEAAKNLMKVDGIHDTINSDFLKTAGGVRAREVRVEELDRLQHRINEQVEQLTNTAGAYKGLPLPVELQKALAESASRVSEYAQTGIALAENLSRGQDISQAQLDAFNKKFSDIELLNSGINAQLFNYAQLERAEVIATAHSLQQTVVFSVACGIGSLLLLLAITLRSIIKPIGAAVNALGLSAAEVDIAAQRMSQRSGDLAKSATEQAAAVQESVASMTEMSSMIAQTSDSSSESLANVRRMAERTEDGNRIMERLASSTEAINQANTQLREMVDIINVISSKTSIINDIVFKTQLLSFNASIEAARAGQHGRGFAVVAEEFGNLAEMSGQAAKEIQALLETSKKHVAEMVEMTHQRVTDGQSVSKEALSIFNEIARETNHISKQIQRITDATREQQIGIQQTSIAMNQMDQAAQRNSHLAGDSLRGAAELSEQSRRLTAIMKELFSMVAGDGVNFTQRRPVESGSSPRAATPPTEIMEMNIDPGALDQAFLQETSNKLAPRSRVPLKADISADHEGFQPYNGQSQR
jgi:methyl-accepting chemotaxis protein